MKKERIKQLKAHIESDDTFETMATFISLYLEEGMYRQGLEQMVEDLVWLQDHAEVKINK